MGLIHQIVVYRAATLAATGSETTSATPGSCPFSGAAATEGAKCPFASVCALRNVEREREEEREREREGIRESNVCCIYVSLLCIYVSLFCKYVSLFFFGAVSYHLGVCAVDCGEREEKRERK